MKPLVMIRDTLEHLPDLSLTAPYTVRSYEPGDEDAWERIVAASFETPRSFQAIMREDPSFAPERLLFVLHKGAPVATAAAWYHPLWGIQYGYLHFVGVVPQHRGHRLGYSVSLAALHRFVAERRSMAVLETEAFRIAAIRTYLRLGFRPQPTGQTRDTWLALSRSLSFPLNLPEDGWIDRFNDQE